MKMRFNTTCFATVRTVHFIVPELDAGNQIVYQGAFSVLPGTSLVDIKRVGESDHEPNCLVEENSPCCRSRSGAAFSSSDS